MGKERWTRIKRVLMVKKEKGNINGESKHFEAIGKNIKKETIRNEHPYLHNGGKML